MKVHETVMVYHDPITRQKPEGKAVLLHKIKNIDAILELWEVCFEGDDGGVYWRTIRNELSITRDED